MKAWVVLVMSLFVVEVSEGADISTTLSTESAQTAVVHPGPQPSVTIRSLPAKSSRLNVDAGPTRGVRRAQAGRRRALAARAAGIRRALAGLERRLAVPRDAAGRRELQVKIGERRRELIRLIGGARRRAPGPARGSR